MSGGGATSGVSERGGGLRAEDTVLRALEVMQRLGLDRVCVFGRGDEELGVLDDAALLRAWSLDPLARLGDLFAPRFVAAMSEDRQRGMLTAASLLGRRGG